MALIDILTHYGLKKKSANVAKTVKYGADQEISTVKPDQYSKRFLDFVNKIIQQIIIQFIFVYTIYINLYFSFTLKCITLTLFFIMTVQLFIKIYLYRSFIFFSFFFFQFKLNRSSFVANFIYYIGCYIYTYRMLVSKTTRCIIYIFFS